MLRVTSSSPKKKKLSARKIRKTRQKWQRDAFGFYYVLVQTLQKISDISFRYLNIVSLIV